MSGTSPQQSDEAARLAAFQEVLLGRIGDLERRFDRLSLNVIRQLEAFIQLHSLLGPMPAPLHGWSISADLALLLERLIQEDPPDLVVEFGSGLSTYVLLAALAHAGVAAGGLTGAAEGDGLLPCLLSFEHLPHCHAASQDLLRSSPLGSRADIRLAQLEPWSDSTGTYSFYGGLDAIGASLAPLRRMDGPVRLLVLVDGPPGSTNPRARYPALPLLLKQLELGGGDGPLLRVDLLLDDLERRDEREVAQSWEERLGERHITYRRREPITENGTLHLSWQSRL